MRPDPEALRGAGLKVTRSRLNIIKVLRENPRRHLTAEAIWNALRNDGKGPSMAGVYRAVSQLEQAGFIRRVVLPNDHAAVFELADSDSHDHMVCLDTGQIIEFRDQDVIEALRQSAERHGYRVETRHLLLHVRRLDAENTCAANEHLGVGSAARPGNG